ncbi:MAG: hypothetical protein EXQ70_04275 [Solirubrobacterales bacterium]|nr:hypothetical protein [Solirubrobacterales bacterium]
MCGQGEVWRGSRIGLILDHVNGVRDDNRLENLRIVCPNCAATLETHCGRRNRVPPEPRSCLHCSQVLMPKGQRQRCCSRYLRIALGSPWPADPTGTKLERPPRERLLREVEALA